MNIFVIGAGVVGSSIGINFIDLGHNVVFVDVNKATINDLKSKGYSAIPPKKMGNFYAEMSIITVPTPCKDDGGVDTSYLVNAIGKLGDWLRKSDVSKHLVVVRSTIPPSTTRDHIIPILESRSGLKVGEELKLCYQPEFLRARSNVEDSKNPWAIVIGEYDEESGDMLLSVYGDLSAPIYRVSIEMAEFIKYICNYFNALKISFSNEIWLLGRVLGLDPNMALEISSGIAEGFWNSRYGIFGGMPYGGSCLPKDTRALYNFARKKRLSMPILKAVMQINSLISQLSKIGIAKDAVVDGPNWMPSPMVNGFVGDA